MDSEIENVTPPNGQQTKYATIENVPPGGERLSYGWWNICPKSLQLLNTPYWFIGFAYASTLIGSFVTSSITFVAPNSIEKYFGITSTKIGALFLIYNFVLGISSFTIGHMCKKHKPRWIAIGLFVMAIGSVMICLPKFLTGTFTAHLDKKEEFCVLGNKTTDSHHAGEVKDWYSVNMVIMALGLLVVGVGSPAIWTLVPAHIEDVTDDAECSLYMGVFRSIIAALAPALAFVVGKPLLSIWVDIVKVCMLYFIINR